MKKPVTSSLYRHPGMRRARDIGRLREAVEKALQIAKALSREDDESFPPVVWKLDDALEILSHVKIIVAEGGAK